MYVYISFQYFTMYFFWNYVSDPSHVIGLFPNLLPEEFRSSLDYPDTLPNLQGTELENGLLALTDYLVEVMLIYFWISNDNKFDYGVIKVVLFFYMYVIGFSLVFILQF